MEAEPLTDNYAGFWAKSQLDNCCHLLGHQTENQLTLGGPCDLLSLPQNFGILFLGETFLCHINLHNESGVECKNVVLKVAVQGSGEYTPLPIRGVSAGHLPSVAEGGGVGGWPMEGCRLRPQENFNVVVQHDLKELGENTLICVVSYVARVPSSSIAVSSSLPQPPSLTGLQQPTTATVGASYGNEGEREVDVPMKFTKNFKFTVGKPFDFKPTQFPTSGSDIYVGAQIENLMPQPIIVERLVWEPGPLTKVTDLNSLVDWTRSRRKGRLTPTYMAPKEVWRLLYLTRPLNPNTMPATGEVKLGHLDIAWRTTMGEAGHLLTFPCESNTPHYSDVSMSVIKLPTQVVVEEPFQMVCEVTNRSSRALELLLSRPETATTPSTAITTTTATINGSETASTTTTAAATAAAFPAFIWTGVTHQRLENLAPAASTRLSFEFVPVMTGLQEVPPFELREVSTEGRFTFSNLGWILVTSAPAA